MGVGRGNSPLATHAIWGFSDPAHAIWWVAGANMQCLVAVKRGRALHLNQSYEALGDFRFPVCKLVGVVLHVGKGAKFGVEKVNGGQNICSRDASVGNGKHFEKQAQSSKG